MPHRTQVLRGERQHLRHRETALLRASGPGEHMGDCTRQVGPQAVRRRRQETELGLGGRGLGDQIAERLEQGVIRVRGGQTPKKDDTLVRLLEGLADSGVDIRRLRPRDQVLEASRSALAQGLRDGRQVFDHLGRPARELGTGVGQVHPVGVDQGHPGRGKGRLADAVGQERLLFSDVGPDQQDGLLLLQLRDRDTQPGHKRIGPVTAKVPLAQPVVDVRTPQAPGDCPGLNTAPPGWRSARAASRSWRGRRT